MVTSADIKVRVLGVGLAVLVGGSGLASAATSGLIPTIKAQDRVIRSTAGYADLTHSTLSTKGQAKKDIPELQTLKAKISQAATAVSHAQTTSATQKAGQKDWVRGAQELADAVGQIDTGLKDLIQNNKTAAATALRRGQKTLGAADKVGNRADKLLGLPKNE